MFRSIYLMTAALFISIPLMSSSAWAQFDFAIGSGNGAENPGQGRA